MELPETGGRAHLSTTPKTGRTTFCLQKAREHISAGKRVIWGSEEMPDNVRFSQIFSQLDISAASRFHAMNTGGEFSRALKDIAKASELLPAVSLVIIDDWTPIQGRPEKDRIAAIRQLVDTIDADCMLLMTSIAYSDASGAEELKVKGQKSLEELGFTTWLMKRYGDDARRVLESQDEQYEMLLEESGFKML